jgi:hypothetical protein
MVLIVLNRFVRLFNKKAFFKYYTLDFPVILDGQFSSVTIINFFVVYD